MQVFISWSGDRSKRFAEEISLFLRRTIQAVTPWLSSGGIPKGSLWAEQLFSALDSSQFGILCMTRENQGSSWIHFEAGALSKAVGRNRIVPLLLDDGIDALSGSLALFNAAKFSMGEMRLVFESLNQHLGPAGLRQEDLHDAFESRWSTFEAAISRIPPSDAKPPDPPSADERMLRVEQQIMHIAEITESLVTRLYPRERELRSPLEDIASLRVIAFARPVNVSQKNAIRKALNWQRISHVFTHGETGIGVSDTDYDRALEILKQEFFELIDNA